MYEACSIIGVTRYDLGWGSRLDLTSLIAVITTIGATVLWWFLVIHLSFPVAASPLLVEKLLRIWSFLTARSSSKKPQHAGPSVRPLQPPYGSP
ncbi:hypothetical protein L6452_24133 [Arctium lappa]|uniref:Uncharacterized protein n=1 Tax=Arctium lappa TaxID=4217 RepID=A0ACB9A888_ARCLA|nr:hypothetical protein L6452_24133 [Arctium lappa]